MFFDHFRRRTSRRSGPAVRPDSAPPRPSAGEPSWSELADETEAFLHGYLAELRAHNDEPLAAWMVLNPICHGDSAELFDIAAGDIGRTVLSGCSSAYHQVWNTTQRNLALRVLETAHDAAGVRELQQHVLVPLELRLITRSRTEPLTFTQVLTATLEALDHHQIDH